MKRTIILILVLLTMFSLIIPTYALSDSNEHPVGEDIILGDDKPTPVKPGELERDEEEDSDKRPDDIGDIGDFENEASHADSKNPNTGGGSIISHGYPEIVYGIGGLAVGFFAGMFIFRKKKLL